MQCTAQLAVRWAHRGSGQAKTREMYGERTCGSKGLAGKAVWKIVALGGGGGGMGANKALNQVGEGVGGSGVSASRAGTHKNENHTRDCLKGSSRCGWKMTACAPLD